MNLGNRILSEMFGISELGVEVKAKTGSDSAGATFSLKSVGARDPDGVEGLHALQGIEPLLLHSADFDDEHAVVDCNRSFGQICRQNDLSNAVSRFFEDGSLLLRR